MADKVLVRAAGLCAIAAALLHIPGLDSAADRDVYLLGATVFTVSLALASLSLVRARGFVRYAAIAWTGSLAAGLLAKGCR
jgi:hypothetical protein